MTVRIVLFTGKGGVGKTTTAAGTAVLAARAGHRTLVLSTDAAHSLGDAFGRPVGSEPIEVAPRLWVHQVDAQRRFERSWGEIQGYLMSVLDAAGVDPITAEELTVIPGAEEVLALLELRNHVVSGDWDVVIVDCAPTAETLRLLALPEALGWYMTRVFGVQRRVVRALRPVLTRAAGVPMPEDSVFDAVERLHGDLEEVQQILTEKDATVRLVLTPETVVVAEARRSLTTLVALRLPRRRGDRQPGVSRGWRRRVAGAAGWRRSRRCSPRCGSPSPTCRSGGPPTTPASRWASTRSPRSPRRRTTGPTRWRFPSGEGPMTITRTEHGCRPADRAAVRPAAGRRPGPPR